MQEVYTNATKVLIDVKQSGNLLYLPLDKLMKVGGDTAAPHSPVATPPAAPGAAPKAAANDKKSRTPDAERSRQRDVR